MKNYKTILNEIKNNSRTIRTYKDKITNRTITDSEYNDYTNARIKSMILSDNCRISFYNYILPAFIELWNKYNGKQYGEKTKEKITAEFKKKYNCSFYFSGYHYGDTLYIYSLDENGYRNGGAVEITIYTKYDNENIERYRFIDNNNKIISVDIDNCYLSENKKYINNIDAHIKKIYAAHEKVKKACADLENACKFFNEITPAKIENQYINGIRTYLI